MSPKENKYEFKGLAFRRARALQKSLQKLGVGRGWGDGMCGCGRWGERWRALREEWGPGRLTG